MRAMRFLATLVVAVFVTACAGTEIVLEPTMPPIPGDAESISVDDLGLALPGTYANVAYGYRFTYPESWFTGFGERPVRVSLSNLDPGSHNRASMRTEGCLIEVTASTNIHGFTLQALRGQIPLAFRDATEMLLNGEPAYLVAEPHLAQGYLDENLYVDHDDRLFILTFQQAVGQDDACRPAWEQVLSTWEWFEPELVPYRNSEYGFGLSYPRQWFRFNSHDRGAWISSVDPSGVRDLDELALQGMLVEIDVNENADELSLQEWLLANDDAQGITSDIPLEGFVGLRVLTQDDKAGVQEMAGYYLGPLGRIYIVRCRYPLERQWEFRPIANGILFSFTF